MKYANNETNQRIEAEPELRAICPECGEAVRSKCGSIKVWHWAHLIESECSKWHEPETPWHRVWKSKFPESWQEICVKRDDVIHRADVRCADGRVIEFQHSSIDPVTIQRRERHYGDMIWIVDAGEFVNNLSIYQKNNWFNFRWRHARKSWATATAPIYFDFGDNLFRVKKIYDATPCYGWGYYIDRCKLIDSFAGNVGSNLLPHS